MSGAQYDWQANDEEYERLLNEADLRWAEPADIPTWKAFALALIITAAIMSLFILVGVFAVNGMGMTP